VETKLDNSVQNGEILPPHYNSPRNDQKRGGGDVLVASKDNIITEALSDYDTNCELCWIKNHLEWLRPLSWVYFIGRQILRYSACMSSACHSPELDLNILMQC